MKSLFRLGATFFIELVFLIVEVIKSFFWAIFYFVFSPTEKYVRNEIVLITGSAKGLGKYIIIHTQYIHINASYMHIGRQIAIEFAKRGSVLVLIDVDDKENNQTVELLKASGLSSKRIFAYHCDLT